MKNFLQNSRTASASLKTTEYQQRFLHRFLLVTIIGLLVQTTYFVLTGNLLSASFNAVVLTGLWVNVYVLQKARYDLASSLMLLLVLSLLLFSIFTYGLSNATIFWFFAFPVLAAFLKGNPDASWWLLSIVLIIFSLYLATRVGWIDTTVIEYDNTTFRQLIAGIFGLAIFTYFYQDYLERGQQSLESAKDKLEDEIALRKAVVVRLAQSFHNAQERNARDEALLNSIGEGVFAVNLEAQIILANPRVESTFGLDHEAWYKLRWYELFTLVDSDDNPVKHADLPLQRALASGEQISTRDFSYRTHEGKLLPVAIIASPVLLHGKQIGAIEVFRDISEEKAVARAKDEFVSLASHQLRTPLSAIKWYAERLLATEDLSGRAHEYLETLHQTSTRMSGLVGDYLNVSRLEMQHYQPVSAAFDVVETIQKIINDIAPLYQQKQLAVQVKGPKSQPLHSDQKLVEMIISNLISNAVKYTPEHGSITVSHAKKSGSLVLKVADTGIGIPDDELPQLYSKLFRASNVKATDIEGTGLGLYSVHAAVEQLGGRMEVASEIGSGTTFTVQLPLELPGDET